MRRLHAYDASKEEARSTVFIPDAGGRRLQKQKIVISFPRQYMIGRPSPLFCLLLLLKCFFCSEHALVSSAWRGCGKSQCDTRVCALCVEMTEVDWERNEVGHPRLSIRESASHYFPGSRGLTRRLARYFTGWRAPSQPATLDIKGRSDIVCRKFSGWCKGAKRKWRRTDWENNVACVGRTRIDRCLFCIAAWVPAHGIYTCKRYLYTDPTII